jgi:zinc protease
MNLSALDPTSFDRIFSDEPVCETLENGLSVVIQPELTNPLVSAQVWVKTGSIHENPLLGSGLSHFLEHMIFKGTSKRALGQVSTDVQAFGGHINAYTAFDRTVYLIDGPSTATDEIIEILSDITLDSTLPEHEVLKEKDVILREIDMGIDDPDRLVSRKLLATAFREHPYRFPVIGHRALFEKINREQLNTYYKNRYQPNNMVLVITGNVEPESVLETIKNTFGQFSMGTVPMVTIVKEPLQLAMRKVELFGDYNICRQSFAYKIPSMRHPDAPALDVMAAVIGSGYSGKLRKRLRDQLKVVHSVSAATWNPGETGLFWFSLQCDIDKAQAAEEALIEEIQDLMLEPLPDESIEKARRYAIVSEIQSRQTTSGIASRLGLISAMVGDLAYPKRFLEAVQRVTPEDLRSLASTYFKPDQLSTCSLNHSDFKNKRKLVKSVTAKESFTEEKLSNGARIIFQRDSRLPRVHFRYAALGGPNYEDPKAKGSNALLSTMLTKDTRYHSAAQISDLIESSGGTFTDFCGNNSFGLSLEIMPQDSKLALNLLENALLCPLFKPTVVALEKDAQMAAIKEMEDDVLDFSRNQLRQLFFANHPFASDVLGDLESLKDMGPMTLKSLHRRLLLARNSVLVVTGDFDPDVIIPQCEMILMDLPDWSFRATENHFENTTNAGIFTKNLPRNQAIVLDAFKGPGVCGKDHLIADLSDEFLSDMAGPLFQSVREDQSLAYFVGASRIIGLNYGMFYLYAGTHPDSVDQVYEAFDTQLDRIRNGDIDPQAFKNTVTRLKVQKAFALQSPGSRANRVALNALYNLPIEDWLNYDEQCDSFTPASLATFAQSLELKNRLRLTVTP